MVIVLSNGSKIPQSFGWERVVVGEIKLDEFYPGV